MSQPLLQAPHLEMYLPWSELSFSVYNFQMGNCMGDSVVRSNSTWEALGRMIEHSRHDFSMAWVRELP